MGKLRKLAGETAIYGISSIIGRAVNFLLVPFYTTTSVLAVAEYGIVTELYSYVAVLNVIYLYGMETAYFRFTSRSDTDEKTVYNTAFNSIFTTTLLFSLILVLFASPIVNWLEFPGKERFVYWFAAIISIDSIVAIPFVKLRYEGKARQFATYKLINIFLNVGLNLFFLYFCKNIYQGEMLPGLKDMVDLVYNPQYNVEYVFISNLVANAFFLVLLFGVIRKARINIKLSVLKPMLIYATPLLLSQIAGQINEMFSRMMLKKLLPEGFYEGFTSQEALSVFGACYKFTMIMTLAIQAYRFAAEPFFFKESVEKDSKDTYARIFYYFAIAGLFAVLAASLNLDLLKYIFLRDEVYWTGLHIIPVLLGGSLFLGLYYNISIWFKITDKTYFGIIITGSAALLTILLNLFLIPVMGYEGSALTTLIVYVYICVFAYISGRKHYPVPYNIPKILLYMVIALFLLVAGWNIQTGTFWVQQLLKEIPLLIFVVVVWMTQKKPSFNKN